MLPEIAVAKIRRDAPFDPALHHFAIDEVQNGRGHDSRSLDPLIAPRNERTKLSHRRSNSRSVVKKVSSMNWQSESSWKSRAAINF
ncbi:hypothetical protein ABH999_000665 [Bradyrhizobium yuanmingense]